MRQFIILAAVTALAVAKPELYKEKEDFEFSRSSTDEGSKSGFYGAQRGNMGGNYERAHNMDSLAQNQMSGLVRQVEGELGDGAKMRAGSVYTAANSRGTYGSRHYDLSNLAGRNFQESLSHDNAQLNSGLSSSAFNNAAYSNRHSQSSQYAATGYQAAEHTGLNLQSDSLQSLDNAQGRYDYGRQSSDRQDAAYAGYGTADLHSSNYGSNVQTRLISATPVRIIVRPGTKVAIPVSAQTYDDKYGSQTNQNYLNSEAEVLANDKQRTIYRPSNAKHYEASYNYRKQWEKHDTIPATISIPTSTDNPFPRNSELYEDNRARASNDRYEASRLDSQRLHSSNVYGGYDNVKSASHRSNSNYNTQQQRASSVADSNAYTVAGYNAGSQGVASETDLYGRHRSQYNGGAIYHGAALDSSSLTQAAGFNTASAADLNSQVESLNSKPKSYQSSYSYHKSWERQGDPYVIKPASSGIFDGQSPQRLTSATKSQGYATSGSHYGHSHQSSADCDENGHIRVARSHNSNPYYETQQQSQNLEDFGQQAEDLGQQTVTDWDQQQSQSTWDKAENLSQQTQQTWDKYENLGQQSHNTFDKLENLDQQTQNNLGQQIQDSETEIGNKPSHFGQESQHEWDFSNTGQQVQDKLNEQTQDFQQTNVPETPLFTQESQQETNNQNSHHMNVWDTFGSHQSETHKFPSQDEHTTVNGHNFNWHSISEHEHAHSSWSNSQQAHEFAHHIEHSNTQGHSTLSNGDRNIHSYNQHNEGQNDENSGHEFHHSYGNNKWNASANTHDLSTNTNSNSDNTFQSNSASLSKLWNKLNNIEQLSIPSSTNEGNAYIHKVNDNSQTSSQNSDIDFQQEQINHTSSATQQQTQDSKTVINNTNKTNETQIEKESSHDVERPQDVGRGDISSEDLTQDLRDENKYYRNPITATDDQTHKKEDINNKTDLENDNSNTELSVLGLNQQNSKEQRIQHTFNVMNTNTTSIQNNLILTHEQKLNITEHKKELNMNFSSNDDALKYFQISGVHTPEYVGQQENLEQQNLQEFGPQENLEQHNLQNFGQQENLEQQNLQDFGQLENQEQQNIQDFGQQVNLEQHNIHDIGLAVKLEQENLQDFGQKNLEQQNLQDFGHPQNNEQQNLQNFGEHEKLEQNLQEFNPQENLEQQNLEDFGQRSLEQQNLQDFGQQQNLQQQSSQDFTQQQNLEQQSLHDFGQQQNLEQQILQDFAQQQNLEQQSSHDFAQQQNLEQQSLHDFGQQQNLEQQSLQDFAQQQNLEQQSSHDFAQQQNLEQQGLHDFGQQQNLEQQSLQDFAQQQNLEQQSSHDFAQQQNLEQQSLHDFGQQQQTVQNYGHQSLDHTDLNQFDQHLSSKNLDEPQSDLQHPAEIAEPVFVKKQNKDTHSSSISQESPKSDLVSPIETETEKPGFWKSVGNKFSTAKSKISSWFGS